MRNTSLRIPLQKRLAVWYSWRVASIVDGNPEGADDNDPGHGRPAGVGEQANEAGFEAGVEDATVGGEDDSGDAEVDIRDVEPGEVVEEDDTEAGKDGGAADRVALVQIRFKRTGRLKGLGLTAEPLWQKERADDRERDIRCHP